MKIIIRLFSGEIKTLSTMTEEADPTRCSHVKLFTECCTCQMVAFLCLNQRSTELPYMVEDASRLIFKHLQLLYEEEQRERECQFILSRQFMEFSGNDEFYARSLFVAKKRYASTTMKHSVANILLGADRKSKEAEKLKRLAQKQEARRRR